MKSHGQNKMNWYTQNKDPSPTLPRLVLSNGHRLLRGWRTLLWNAALEILRLVQLDKIDGEGPDKTGTAFEWAIDQSA